MKSPLLLRGQTEELAGALVQDKAQRGCQLHGAATPKVDLLPIREPLLQVSPPMNGYSPALPMAAEYRPSAVPSIVGEADDAVFAVRRPESGDGAAPGEATHGVVALEHIERHVPAERREPPPRSDLAHALLSAIPLVATFLRSAVGQSCHSCGIGSGTRLVREKPPEFGLLCCSRWEAHFA